MKAGKKFDCSRCLPAMKIENGCVEDSPLPGRWEILGEVYKRCPVRLVSGRTWLFMRLYQQYKQGFLPSSGGILDQTAVFLEAVEILERAIN